MLSNMGAANTKLIFRQNDENLKSEILKEINKKENVFSEKDIAINNLKIELSKYKLDDPTQRIKYSFSRNKKYIAGKN